jgi:hypothetical protein
MSSSLAIAAVTAVMKDLLNNGLIDHSWTASLNPVTVSALPPDRVAPVGATPDNQLNLFLYLVSPNTGWSNAALPSRDARGVRTSNPPLALNLHYLLTAYGRQDFHAEVLLGYAMQLFHETPVLTRGAIRDSLNALPVFPSTGLPPNSVLLSTSNLADQVEQIKICPQYLSTEEISKLWAAFQTHYRPTAAYLASVVLIQNRQTTRTAPLVARRRVHVMPLRQPLISMVEPQMIEFAPGITLTVRGQNLSAPDTTVQFGALEVTPSATLSSDEQLVVPLPAGLRAGINPVQVIRRLLLDQPPLHRGFESNVAAFVLRPTIKKRMGTGGVEEDDITVVATAAVGNLPSRAAVTIKIAPDIGKSQEVLLLLNELNPPATEPLPRSYRFAAPSREQETADSTDEITFPTTGLPSGDYLVRVQVEGAQSSLEGGVTTPFSGPRLTIP